MNKKCLSLCPTKVNFFIRTKAIGIYQEIGSFSFKKLSDFTLFFDDPVSLPSNGWEPWLGNRTYRARGSKTRKKTEN